MMMFTSFTICIHRTPDYDSWGEESSDDDDYLDDNDEEEKIEPVRKKNRHRNSVSKKYKPQPYPPNMYLHPQVIYGAPYSLYYPPPPAGTRKSKNR